MINVPVQSDNSPEYCRKIALGVRGIYEYVRPVLTNVSADYDIATPNELVIVDASAGNIILTLPSAKAFAREVISVVRTDNTGNTVSLASPDTVNGQPSIPVPANYGNVKVASTGLAWIGV